MGGLGGKGSSDEEYMNMRTPERKDLKYYITRACFVSRSMRAGEVQHGPKNSFDNKRREAEKIACAISVER